MTEGHGDPEIQMALLDTENMTETGIDLLLGELETCMKHPNFTVAVLTIFVIFIKSLRRLPCDI